MTRQWRLSINNVGAPAPDLRTEFARAEKDRLLAVWSTYIEPVTDDGAADSEDFFEQAIRLDAAVRTFGPANIWVGFGGAEDLRNLGDGRTMPFADARGFGRFGMQSKDNLVEDMLSGSGLPPLHYFTLNAFRANAGRMAIPSTNAPGVRGLIDDVMDVAQVNDGRVFIKAIRPKGALFDVTIEKPASRHETRLQVLEALDWNSVLLEEVPDAYLVQQHIDMRYEYRVFVVGGRAVTGAGCIEEFTPLDNCEPFDPSMRERRRPEVVIEDRPDLRDRYKQFAQVVADEIGAERPELQNYVIDVALNHLDRPIVIELNELLNSGLYASDFIRVAEAFVSQAFTATPAANLVQL